MYSPGSLGLSLLCEAERSHLDGIAAISLEAFPHDPWDVQTLGGEFDLEFSHCLVALGSDDGSEPRDGEQTLLGYLIYWLVLDEVQILQVATRATARRRGIGRALVSRCLEDSKAKGGLSVMLEVRASNLPAQGLYRSLGFGDIALRRAYYRAPVEDAVIMLHRLGAGEALP